MNRTGLLSLILILSLDVSAFVATSSAQGRGGAPPIKSPEIGADQRVTFRLRAPNATTVAVLMGGKQLPMQKDAGAFSSAQVMWNSAMPNAANAPARGAGAGRGAGAAPSTMDEAVFAKMFPTLEAKANSRLRMLWITCGTSDSLIGVNRQFKSWLKSKGVAFTELETPDVGHVWPYWRQNLTDMAPQLFQARGN